MTEAANGDASADGAASGDGAPDGVILEEPVEAAPEGSQAGDSGDAGEHVEVERDLEELSAKAQKAQEYLELAQRTKADFENYRRRTAREAALAQERGIAKLAKELLPAIDNLERALAAAAAEDPLLEGIKMVQADLLSALARVGIEPFSPAGEQFDPQLHEAVAQHPFEDRESGTVVEVYQQGYRLGETVLRPARVLVAA